MPLEACVVLQSMLEVMDDTFIVLSRVQFVRALYACINSIIKGYVPRWAESIN